MPSRILLAALAGCLTPGSAHGADQAALAVRWSREIEPVVEKFCHDCHADGIRKGGMDFDRYPTIAKMQADRPQWLKVRDYLGHDLMPPVDESQPSDAERAALVAWIDAAVFPVDPEHPDPGHVVLRRLNRTEYQNTLHDLLGIDLDLAGMLPPDDSGHGFDNIGGVLTVSPTHVERYLEAARIALDQVVEPGEAPYPVKKFPGSKLDGPGGRDGGAHLLSTNGTAQTRAKIDKTGPYRIVVSASGTPCGDQYPRLELIVDGKPLHAWEVKAPQGQPADHSFDLTLPAGEHLFGLAFTNDRYLPDHPDPSRRDCNLEINSLRIIGPLDGPRLQKGAPHRRIFGDAGPGADARGYASGVLERFARRAFRRPPQPEEIARYLGLIEQITAAGDDLDSALRLALEAMLVSPAFLFREEPATAAADDGKQPISEHALAARLSYFLWSTMPDEPLSELADQGQLRANLDREIGRMLDSPRRQALSDNFLGQWLQLRDLPAVAPDRGAFPDFDPQLLESMARESELMFEHILDQNLPLRTLLDADFSFLDDKLARHYGVDGVTGSGFQKTPLAGTTRGGLLGQGAFLLVTSHSTRTSPVLRGKFVLENLLNTPPPPPPPNVPAFTPTRGDKSQLTLRRQFEAHRQDPACAACHALLDPIGFGLENFDAIGRWREKENGHPLDTSATLSTGESFTGPDELRRILSGPRLDDFHRCVASKLLTYALGRGIEWFDKPAIDRIVAESNADAGRLRTMIKSIVHSVPFQYRRTAD